VRSAMQGRAQCLVLRAQGSGLRAQGSGLRAQGSGLGSERRLIEVSNAR
jgi:hypothetical protein